MKYIIFAFFISIALHLLTFTSIKLEKEKLEDSSSTSKKITKSNINYVHLKSVQKEASKEEKKVEKSNEVKKELQEKKIEKKEPPKKIVKREETYKKVYKKSIPIPKKREVIKETPKEIVSKPVEKKEVTPNYSQLNPTKLQKNTLESFLSTPSENEELIDDITKSYIKLYGEEYNSFTKIQKVYLKKNLKNIGMITQKYLKYPSIAVRTRQSGTNVIEFTLYPNGDITKPVITSSSGYEVLDDNTIETIEFAYKDYPRPDEPTKIRIYVTYRLY